MKGLRPAHVGLLIPWVVAVVAARLPLRDNSFLWHVRAGTLQIDSGSVLTADPFSFTFGGTPWRTQSWLLELGYGRLEGLLDLGFVPWFVGSTAVSTFALLGLAVYRRSRSVEATALLGVATAWLAAAFLNPRPVLASYPLFAALVVVAADRRLRWTLPLIAWLWASVHGSFIVGIGYVILDGLRWRRRGVARDAVVMSLASTAGAHGLGVWAILGEFAASRGALQLITEWRTPNFTSVANLPFLVGLLLLLFSAMHERVKVADLWIAGPFLAFGMMASRSVLPAWIALAPMAGAGLACLSRGRKMDRPSRLVLPLAGLGVLILPFVIPMTGGRFDERFPVEAAGHVSGRRVFHDDVAGGYLIYARWPKVEVFVDDRAELFGVDHLRDTRDSRNGTPRWSDVFGVWQIDQALVRVNDGLLEALKAVGWTESYRDEGFVVLDRP